MEKEKSNLPKISDLYKDTEVQKFSKSDALNFLVNQLPKKEWIRKNPYANNSLYIPIAIVETLLLKIFKQIRIEVIEYKSLFNAVACHVRLYYIDVTSGEWTYHDGLGAVEMQTSAGSGCLKPDFSNINKGAVMMALPMAKSFAIKDAAEHIGCLFGRDLNRKDIINYKQDSDKELEEIKELFEFKRESLTEDEINFAERIINTQENASYVKLKKSLKEK